MIGSDEEGDYSLQIVNVNLEVNHFHVHFFCQQLITIKIHAFAFN